MANNNSTSWGSRQKPRNSHELHPFFRPGNLVFEPPKDFSFSRSYDLSDFKFPLGFTKIYVHELDRLLRSPLAKFTPTFFKLLALTNFGPRNSRNARLTGEFINSMPQPYVYRKDHITASVSQLAEMVGLSLKDLINQSIELAKWFQLFRPVDVSITQRNTDGRYENLRELHFEFKPKSHLGPYISPKIHTILKLNHRQLAIAARCWSICRRSGPNIGYFHMANLISNYYYPCLRGKTYKSMLRTHGRAIELIVHLVPNLFTRKSSIDTGHMYCLGFDNDQIVADREFADRLSGFRQPAVISARMQVQSPDTGIELEIDRNNADLNWSSWDFLEAATYLLQAA